MGMMAEKWDVFAEHNIPEDSSEEYRKEMQWAFYVGARAMREVLMSKEDEPMVAVALGEYR